MNDMPVLLEPIRLLTELMWALHISTTLVAMYMIRFLAAMLILPSMGGSALNGMSQTGIALLLAAFTAYGRSPDELANLTGGLIGMIAIKEALLGVALGFAMSTAYWVVQNAGVLIDNAAGYNSIQLRNPQTGWQSTPVSDLLLNLAVAVFFSLGGAVYFAEAIFESYRVWPLVDLLPSAQNAYLSFIEQQVGDLFGNTLKLAAPVIIVVALIDVGFGLLARSAEKLEPASLSQPVKGVVCIVMVSLFISVAFSELRQHLLPRGLVQQIAPKPR